MMGVNTVSSGENGAKVMQMRRVKKRATIISTGFRFPRNARNGGGIVKNNRRLIFLTVIFICGLLLGSTAIKNKDAALTEELKSLIENFCRVRSQSSLAVNFFSIFGTECIFLIPAMLFGVCSVGEPFLWLLPLGKGMGLGMIAAYLYSEHSLNGMLYFAAILLPPSVFSAAALLLGCKESILMTHDINRVLLGKREKTGDAGFFKLYILRYIVLLASVLLASGLGALLNHALSGRINLFSA